MPDGGLINVKAELSQCPDRQDNQSTDFDISDHCICISVTDTGVGMTEQVRTHATEPFFTTSKNEGTGLGLSMVYGFMRQSRGELIIESSPGQGTCIKMLFPVYGGKQQSTENKPVVQKISQVSDATILVVDDHPEVRQFAVRCLDNLKLKILQAEDAASAKRVLEDNNDIDLLFTDILMPGDMTGRDLASWAVEKYPRLKILLTSAAEKETGNQHISSKPVFELLPKPYNKKDLLERIHDIL